MISKGEAIQRLKKMGVSVADDQSMVTILLPSDVSFAAGIKDIREKLKNMDYESSFCIRQDKAEQGELAGNKIEEPKPVLKEFSQEKEEKEEPFDEEDDLEALSEEDLNGSLLAMDDDGQFSLGGFGLEF